MSNPDRDKGALLWFRTPDPMKIASDPPGYTIHKTPADPANGKPNAVYELRRDIPDSITNYEVIGTSHLCEIAMAAGERDYHDRNGSE